jgi:antibiotic biosynthesis monooxygenase (ABM) superfamily enzyme
VWARQRCPSGKIDQRGSNAVLTQEARKLNMTITFRFDQLGILLATCESKRSKSAMSVADERLPSSGDEAASV